MLKIFSLAHSAIHLSNFWLLTTPPQLEYVATLPCNLSFIACFADFKVSMAV